jgi:DNA-binding response OmpR family regulator
MTDSHLKILVVEDHPDMRKFMEEFCSLHGYEADFACNGREALKLVEEELPYGLAIVDFLLPEMHGAEFVRKAKQKWADLPVIAISAFDDAERTFLDAGADIFLKKPFDPYYLEEVVARLARLRR